MFFLCLLPTSGGLFEHEASCGLCGIALNYLLFQIQAYRRELFRKPCLQLGHASSYAASANSGSIVGQLIYPSPANVASNSSSYAANSSSYAASVDSGFINPTKRLGGTKDDVCPVPCELAVPRAGSPPSFSYPGRLHRCCHHRHHRHPRHPHRHRHHQPHIRCNLPGCPLDTLLTAGITWLVFLDTSPSSANGARCRRCSQSAGL